MLVAMVVSESVIFLAVSLDEKPIRRATVNFFRNIFAEVEDWFFISFINWFDLRHEVKQEKTYFFSFYTNLS